MLKLRRDRLKQQIIKNEGVRTKPYLDSEGILTIGVGRNLEDKGLSESEVMILLDNDIEDACIDARRAIGASLFVTLNGPRQAVLVRMAFNLGAPRLRGFVKMRAALYIGDYNMAAAEMLDSKWARQVGARAEELARQMRSGKYED